MLPIRREAFSWILLLLSLVALSEPSPSSEGRVVCYYTNWSIYRPGTAKFSPQNINPYLCTHLIYSFGGFTKDNKLKPFDKYQDIEKGGYAKFTGLKTYNKNLKTLLAIGGWNEGSSRFSSMVASADRRREFVKNSVKFLRQNHFDGLDLDWEYPAFRDGGKPRDKDNYAQFVQELREEFERESDKTGRPRLLLTMAVPAGTEYIQKGYDIPKLNKYLDWFNLLTYDYHSAFEPSVNHHAPLRSLEKASEYNYDSDLNIDYSVKFYINEGADPSKLVLGIPTYGRSYTLLNEESTDMGAPTDGPGAQGDATREKGYLAYYEICQSLKEDDSWTVVQPNPDAVGPYAFRANQWVGYDDEAIARKKGEYVVANGLGGIMFWSIDNDDFRGTCHGKPYPIIEAAKEAMLNKIGGNENEVLTPARRKKPSRSRSRTNSSPKTNNVNDQDEEKITQRRPNTRRKPTPSSTVKEAAHYSSARTTTPPPPTTPDPGSDFKCEEEGFYPHPRDCKKYFWCLDSGPSNLGIVPNLFTCPSGLVFNKATDSCDYTRNVVCPKPKSATESESTTESTAAKVSSTAKSILIGRPSTTTPAQEEEETEEEEEEYDDEEIPEDDDKAGVSKNFEHALEEEDPEVIKELITLIRRVGGLDELEKQLQMRLNLNQNSAIVGTNGKTTTTTISPINKSLYNKVLATKRGNQRAQKVFSSTTQKITEIEPLVQRQNKENRYSSVIRNSRPRPQNDGLEKLSEVEGGGMIRERPQYTTITRTHAPKTQTDEDESEHERPALVTQLDANDDAEEDDNSPTTHQPIYNYVNIQRARPSSTAVPVEDAGNESDDEAEDEEEEDEEEEQPASVSPTSTSKMHYVNIQRIRPTKPQYISDEIESETPVPESKYQSVSRKRPTTTQISIVDKDDDSDGNQRYSTSTVESVNNHFTNTPETSTRSYGSLNRRTTTIQTEQYSTPQTSSSYPYPSTTTSKVTTNDNTNTHDSQLITNDSPTQLNDLGNELTSTLTPNIDNSNGLFTTDGSFGSSPIPTTSIDTDTKTDTILTQTNKPHLTISKYSILSDNTDHDSISNHEQTEHNEQSIGSKLTTTSLPTENPSSPTVTPSSFVVDHHREFSTTQSNQFESSSLYKPTYGGGISSPRPFSYSKRTRPTTTTTSTTELTPSAEKTPENGVIESKVSVASNQNTNELVGTSLVGEQLITKELQGLNQLQVSDRANVAALNVTFYSIANATNDDEHTVLLTNDTNSIEHTSDSLSNTSQAPPSTVSSIVNSSIASANIRTRNKSRVNTQQTTEQSDVSTHRFANQRLRTRPPARKLHLDNQEQLNPILDDNVRHVTYNIARQNTRTQTQTDTEVKSEAVENEYNARNNYRTNVIREKPASRRFRPKLSDLIQETSNGLPNIAINNEQEFRPYRPDESNRDFSSLTSIDFNRKQNSQETIRSQNSRRRPTRPAKVIAEENLEIQQSSESSPTTPGRRVSNRYNTLHSRTRVSNNDAANVEQSHDLVLTETATKAADSEVQQTIVVPLSRKLNIDSSFQNRVNSVERKKSIGQKPFVEGGDSPIIYLHPDRYSTKVPLVDFKTLNLEPNLSKNLKTNLNINFNVQSNAQNEVQSTKLPVTTESLKSLAGDYEDHTPMVLETIENRNEDGLHGTNRLIRQKVEEIQEIIGSFQSTDIPLATDSSTTNAPNVVSTTSSHTLASIAKAINALDEVQDLRSIEVSLATEANTAAVSPANPNNLASLANAINALNAEVTTNGIGSPERNVQIVTDENRLSSENVSREQTSYESSSVSGQRRQRPTFKRTTTQAPEINASTENQLNERRRFQSRNRFSSTTTEQTSVSSEEFSGSTLRTQQRGYRGRVKASQATVNRYLNKIGISRENVVNENSNGNFELQSSTENIRIQLAIEDDQSSVEISSIEKTSENSLASSVEVATEAGEIRYNLNNSAEVTEGPIELTTAQSIPSENLLPPTSESVSAETQSITETEQISSTAPSSSTESNIPRKNVFIRRRPVNGQRIESGSAEIQTVSETKNENPQEDVLVQNEVRRRKIFRGRIQSRPSSSTESNIEENVSEENEQNVELQTTRQRRPFPRRRFSTSTTESADVNENAQENIEENQENQENQEIVDTVVKRQRQQFPRRRLSTTTTETTHFEENVQSENVQSENVEQNFSEENDTVNDSRQRRPFARRRFSTTTAKPDSEASVGSENVEDEGNAEISLIKQRTNIRGETNENDGQVNRFAQRRRPAFQRVRTSTESVQETEENLNENQENNENVNIENKNENVRIRINQGARRRPFAPRARTSTDSAVEVEENENVEVNLNQNVNENLSNEDENIRVRVPAFRRRPFGSRTSTTTTESDEVHYEENQEVQTNEEISEQTDLVSKSQTRQRQGSSRRPYIGRARFSTTSAPAEEQELNQNEQEQDAEHENEHEHEHEQVSEESNAESTPRSRPFYKRKKITSFKAINIEESLARGAAGNIRLRTKPAEHVGKEQTEAKEVESTKTQIDVSERIRVNRKLFANRRTTKAPTTENAIVEENATKFSTESNAFGPTETYEDEVTQVTYAQYEMGDIETGTLSDALASTELYNEYVQSSTDSTKLFGTESTVEEISTESNNAHAIESVSQIKIEQEETDLKSETVVEPNSQSNVETSEQTNVESNSESINKQINGEIVIVNGKKRRRKLKLKSTSTTAASVEEPETASEESTKETIAEKETTPAVTGTKVAHREFVSPSLRFRESRKQLIKTKQTVENTLDEKKVEETDQAADQADHERENEKRPRPLYSPKFVNGRIQSLPRPSLSLTSTTESQDISDNAEVTRKTFVRKYTKVFKLPKSPVDDTGDHSQGYIEQQEHKEQIEQNEHFEQNEEIKQNEEIEQNEENNENVEIQAQDDDQTQTEQIPTKGYRKNKFSKHANSGAVHPASLRPLVKRPTQSTEATVVLDGINVNAISVRNRNLFNKNSKKHSFSKVTDLKQSSQFNTNTDNDDTFTETPIPIMELAHTENPSSNIDQQYVVTESVDDNVDANTYTNTMSSLTSDDDNINEVTTIFTSINAINEQDQSFEPEDRSTTDNIPTEHNLSLNSINLVDNLQEATTTLKPLRKYVKSTTVTPSTVKPTTYHHVFAIDYDENPFEKHLKHIQKPNEIGQDDPNAAVIAKKVEKLAEVSRIVEVYSQQRRQTIQRSSNAKQKSENSNLIIERLPTVNKLGEINRVTLIKLVDHQNDSKPTAKEFITFLTTTARPAVDTDEPTAKKSHEKKARQIILPDNIFSVETSTIPLEGLFQTDRNGKKLNIVYATTADDSFLRSSPSPVFISHTTTETPSQTTISDGDIGDTTADSVNDIHVVKAKQSNTLQINDSTPPLVISLANLDNVVLSQLTPKNATKITKANAFDGAVASSGKVSTIIDAPHVVVEHSTVVNLDESASSAVNTQTSYSSEITQSKIKLSQLNAPSDDKTTEVRPQFRPGFRRPTITAQKKSKPTQSNDINDTTESSASVTTRKSANSPYVRRRSRPTYIPTTSHTTVAAIASTVANRNNDTIVSKILQRRKFGRPTSSAAVAAATAVSTTNIASERKRINTQQTKYRPTTESATVERGTTRTTNPFFRRRFGYTSSTKPPKTTTIDSETVSISGISSARHNTDQEHEPSILDRKFSQSNQIDLGTEIISQGLGEAITSISRAPLPYVASTTTVRNVKITTPGAVKYHDDSEYQISKRADSLSSGSIKPLERQRFVTTVQPELLLPHSEIHDSRARPSRDFKRTQKVIRTFSQSNLNADPNAKVTATLKDKPKKIAFRPAADYDYYDDQDSILSKSTSKVKVILHDAGIIECLDQGNFPHPLSCRKFISCAKMEIGGVVGWEYTCPKGLSYDPVGGICNWAAGLGCKE